MKDQSNTDQTINLRARAEAIAQSRQFELGKLSSEEKEELLHELQIHQVELELQNQEMRRVQQNLVASQRRYAELYHAAPVGYFTLKAPYATIVEANRTGAAMLGVKPARLTSRRFTDFVAPDDQDAFYLYSKELASRTSSPSQSDEIEIVPAEGARFHAKLQGAKFKDSDRYLLVVSDITERKQAEKQRLELAFERERVKILQNFLGDASHDLKTPLTTIKVSLAVLQKTPDSKKRQRHLEILETQVAHLERLLDDLLHMVRLDTVAEVELTMFNVNALIQRIVAEHKKAAKQKGLTIEFSSDAAACFVVADEDQINRAITAIFVNAVSYTPRDGAIIIRTYLQEQQLIIEIEDTGIGIGEVDLPHIFKRFYRADEARNADKGGMGLGLTIAKKIVEMHRGRITVESIPGNGSTFKIRLPLVGVR